MSSKMTNYYQTNTRCTFTMVGEVRQRKGRPWKYISQNQATIDEIVAPGIANAATLNRNYKKLVGALKIDQHDNNQILELLGIKSQQDDILYQSLYRDQKTNHESDEIADKIAATVLHLRLTKKWSIASLSAKFGVSLSKIQSIFKNAK